MGKSSTSFYPKWNLGETTVIRVPAVLAPHLLAIAKTLDENAASIQPPPAKKHAIASDLTLTKPFNVASVTQLSPFRYPGGKTWLIPYIRAWLLSKAPKATRFVEPFAGGAIVSLS